MKRNTHPDRLANANGSGKDGYTDGDPGVDAPTVLEAVDANHIQEEICAPIEAALLDLDSADKNQLQRAISHYFKTLCLQNIEGEDVGANLTFNACAVNDSGLFVLVGAAGKIYTGFHARDLTARTADAAYADTFNVAIWNGSVFVIAGENAEIQTSPDGITWTHRTAGGSYVGDFYGGCWDGTRFVLTGERDGADTTAQTSSTGTTWTKRTIGVGTNHDMADVCAGEDGSGNPRLVAVGEHYVSAAAQTTIVRTSDDGGINWDTRTTAFSLSLDACAWGNGVFIAVGESLILTSPDGVTWTQRDALIGTVDYKGITYLSEDRLFVATFVNSAAGYEGVAWSRDGTDWGSAFVCKYFSAWRLRKPAANATDFVIAASDLGNSIPQVFRASSFKSVAP